jgi:hypothetical protein
VIGEPIDPKGPGYPGAFLLQGSSVLIFPKRFPPQLQAPNIEAFLKEASMAKKL